jgi:probable F420-dependent oxidoreductase
MVLANIGHDMQLLTEGRFVLGLGSQIRPHIENRFSEAWSRPAARMREMVSAVRAIWDRWEGVAPLDFQGEFYRHTLMTPAFDPGPNPFGPPPIFVGGFGPRMVSVAGEVADGLIVHPFTSRRSMEEMTLPALDEGLRRSGRSRDDVQVVWVTMLVTWDDLHGRDEALRSAREQLAFYGSTPAYRPVLEVHGWDGLQPELNRLSKEGRWDEMTAMIPEELVDALAVVAPREAAAARLIERVAGITEHVSLVNNRNPDPAHFVDVVTDLRRLC